MQNNAERKSLTSAPPSGFLRLFLRFPIWFYRLNLGFLLGHRFLLLTHTGRKTGLKRQTVVEVVKYDPSTHTHIVASGWGEKSQWLQNVEAHPSVSIDSAGRHFEATAVRLSVEEARLALLEYARDHPFAFRELFTLMFGKQEGTTEELCADMARSLPLIVFCPEDSQ